MNKVRKTLGSLFRVQETQDATEATTAEANTEETPESADETTETDETEEEESTSEASTDETTTVEATTTTVAETVTMSLAAYNKLKADADSVPGLSKKVAELSAKAKKWDAHQAAVQGITPSGDLNSTLQADENETAADAETKRLKGRYGKLID